MFDLYHPDVFNKMTFDYTLIHFMPIPLEKRLVSTTLSWIVKVVCRRAHWNRSSFIRPTAIDQQKHSHHQRAFWFITSSILGPRQMYSNPSIKPYPHFNAQHDADSLRNAMKGFGCNRTRVIEILCQRSNAQVSLYKFYRSNFHLLASRHSSNLQNNVRKRLG